MVSYRASQLTLMPSRSVSYTHLGIGTVAGVLALVFLGYLLVRRNKYEEGRLSVSAVHAAGVKAAK